MTDPNALLAAVSLAVVDSENEQRTLLQSVVLAARAIFDAAASSIFLLDKMTNELVFEAVAGEGEGVLVGSRFSASKGIAGWVLVSAQPIIVDRVDDDPRWARDIAEATNYVPATLMAAPVVCDEEPIGVLEVLDSRQERPPLGQLELLSLFGLQAAAALRIVQRSRAARSLLGDGDSDLTELMDVVRYLDGLDHERRRAGLRMFGSMRAMLDA